jgi:hypothetical protein
MSRRRYAVLAAFAAFAAFAALGASLVVAPSADAATRVSTRALLNDLVGHAEHHRGYDRDKFADWRDADGDGCDTRDEVLMHEAIDLPSISSGCRLSSGRWFSKYDGVTTTDPSNFDIDHMVPLAEAWQSGAHRWSSATRARYSNDLRYGAALIAVTAHANRSKGEQEPQDWMPERSSYRCTYLANWVAVKWRWHLKVNSAEESFLRSHLRACDWPTVVKPSRATITLRSVDGGGSDTGGSDGSGGSLDPRFSYCYQAIDAGYGPYYEGVDPEYGWYDDADNDGVVCE